MYMKKIAVKNLALAGGIYGAGCVALVTILALLKIPGYREFAELLTKFYGFYGYSINGYGIVIGAFWGFVEGFVHVGVFALIYNYLQSKLQK